MVLEFLFPKYAKYLYFVFPQNQISDTPDLNGHGFGEPLNIDAPCTDALEQLT